MSDAWLEELPYEECVELLAAQSVGRIAVIVEGGPVVVPVNYRLVESPRCHAWSLDRATNPTRQRHRPSSR